jgi:hypothetical protein
MSVRKTPGASALTQTPYFALDCQGLRQRNQLCSRQTATSRIHPDATEAMLMMRVFSLDHLFDEDLTGAMVPLICLQFRSTRLLTSTEACA